MNFKDRDFITKNLNIQGLNFKKENEQDRTDSALKEDNETIKELDCDLNKELTEKDFKVKENLTNILNFKVVIEKNINNIKVLQKNLNTY